MKTSRSDEGNAATGEQSGEQFGEHQIVKNDEAASKEPERYYFRLSTVTSFQS